MSKSAQPFDPAKFINPSQVGGIDSYTIDEGPARGVRAACFNTGGGLRYRVLVDRGLDIDQAFFDQHSLRFSRTKASPHQHAGWIRASIGSEASGADWSRVAGLSMFGPWARMPETFWACMGRIPTQAQRLNR